MFQVKDLAVGSIKYAARSRAIVIDNDDPLKRGRIRVNSPVLGETNWIPYLTTPGTFNVPAVDSVVYIEADGGFYSHPVAWGNFNAGTDSDLKFPEVFQRVSPTNRGIYTPGGLLLEIDDGTDPIAFTKRGVRLKTTGETLIDLKDEAADKSFSFEFSSGIKLKIDSVSDSFEFESAFGDKIEISAANGIQQTTPAAGGTIISQKAGKIDFTSSLDSTYTSTQGNITVTALGGSVLKLGNGKVGLGGPAGELLAEVSKLADELSKLALEDSTHIHPTAVGPSGPPTNAASMAAVNVAATAIKTIVDLIKGGI